MLAYDFPLLDVFWTILWLFLFFIWIWIAIAVFADIFRSRDMGGFAKALWIVFIIILPLIGVLAYLIVRGGKMHERAEARAQQQEQAFRAYVQDASQGPGSADQLAKLADLRDRGVISDTEFQVEKAKVLGPGTGGSTAGMAQPGAMLSREG